jgi:hypothetical protein
MDKLLFSSTFSIMVSKKVHFQEFRCCRGSHLNKGKVYLHNLFQYIDDPAVPSTFPSSPNKSTVRHIGISSEIRPNIAC